MKNLLFLAVILVILFVNGCGLFKDLGSNFGEGVIEPLGNEADTIGYDLVKGMRESLTEKEFQQKLDSMIINLGAATNAQLKNVLDSLLGVSTKHKIGELRDELIGDTTVLRLQRIRNSILDAYLQQYLYETISQVGPRLLNDSTLQRLASVRDTLLGEKSNELLKAIIDTAMVIFTTRFRSDVSPLLQENLGFVQKNATWLLILIGGIAIAIAGFIWKQKEKYLKMTKLLAYQVSEVPEPKLKETIKDNISKNAKTIGMEDELRKFLDNQGLLHLDTKLAAK